MTEANLGRFAVPSTAVAQDYIYICSMLKIVFVSSAWMLGITINTSVDDILLLCTVQLPHCTFLYVCVCDTMNRSLAQP